MSVYRINSGSTHNLSDTEDFIRLVKALPEFVSLRWNTFFATDADIVVTRAPGRLDVMGGIADYSGSLVLQLPIAAAAHVALQANQLQALRIVSIPSEPTRQPRFFEMGLKEFLSAGVPISYYEARERFKADLSNHWAAYVAGSFLVLSREKGFQFTSGADILVKSSVPEGKGVSSSAALEVAAMQAIVAAFGLTISAQELALLCQKVENLVAGAPCGVMDQMTSACGEAGQLLELVCQPCDLKGNVRLPDDLELWGIDSGIRHSVGGSDYEIVRTAAFMGYRIIAEVAGLHVSSGEADGKVSIDDPRWSGYLANLTPEEFERDYSKKVPEHMSGRDFLNRYQGITDKVTLVRPDVEYPVSEATRHPIFEHARVFEFADILRNWKDMSQASRLGELMFESHESYSRCGLGSGGTDLLVALVRDSF